MLYRYRSTEKLLSEPFSELENQTIYFSSLEELNDPIENFMNIKWKGDEVAWKGLFKHYILCLEATIMFIRLDASIEEVKTIPIYIGNKENISSSYMKKLDGLASDFIKHQIVKSIIDNISTREITIEKYELAFFLNIVHYIAIDLIEIMHQTIFSKDIKFNFPKNYDDFSQLINSYFLIEPDHKEDLCKAINLMIEHLADKANSSDPNFSSQKNFLYFNFHQEYVEQIKFLTYPKRYIACFSEAFDNPVMWGSYGDSNKGVCLVFNPCINDNKKFLEIYSQCGWSSKDGEIFSYNKFELKKVDYTGKFLEINFFESLGSLNQIQLSLWFNDSGKISTYYNYGDDWRNNYWNKYKQIIANKNFYWEYEKEYRIILSSILFEHDSLEKRKLKYKFDYLYGIIFGLSTSREDKEKIISIIANKCKQENRKNFKFYKMTYSQDMNKMIKEECYTSNQSFLNKIS